MRYFIFVFVLIGLVFTGCNLGGIDQGDIDQGEDESIQNGRFSIIFGESDELPQASSRSAPEGLQISFRSSDIEFWSSNGNFKNLSSALYGEKQGANISIAVELSDSADNFVFSRGEVNFGEYSLPEFDTSCIYDVARLDLGGGHISYSIDGNLINPVGLYSLNTNSMVFIDNTVLTEVVYVDRNVANSILSDISDNDQLDDTYDVPDFVRDFIANNGGPMMAYDTTYMDMDGALFVPFPVIAFTEQSVISSVRINIDWDIDAAIESSSEGQYVLDDSADGTPYNFVVSVEIQ